MKQNSTSKESGAKYNSYIYDYCIEWGGPCIIMFICSLFATAIISPRLGGTTFIECGIFIICFFILLFFYISLFRAPMYGLYIFISNRKKKKLSDNGEQIQDVSLTQYLEDAEIHEDAQNDLIPETVQSQNETQLFYQNSEEYTRCYEKRIEAEAMRKKKLQDAIAGYVNNTMAGYIRKEDWNDFVAEIKEWTDKPKYKPKSFELQEELTTLDLRHFIWNIGKRLGKENGYDGQAMADFVKTLFPKVFKDISDDSIKNFTAEPDKGKIKLDRPEPGKFSFHYENRGNYY